jgi:hypothetical protein
VGLSFGDMASGGACVGARRVAPALTPRPVSSKRASTSRRLVVTASKTKYYPPVTPPGTGAGKGFGVPGKGRGNGSASGDARAAPPAKKEAAPAPSTNGNIWYVDNGREMQFVDMFTSKESRPVLRVGAEGQTLPLPDPKLVNDKKMQKVEFLNSTEAGPYNFQVLVPVPVSSRDTGSGAPAPTAVPPGAHAERRSHTSLAFTSVLFPAQPRPLGYQMR